MDAGARTSLFQIKRRACGGRPMTAAAARRRVLCAARGGLGDVSSSTRVRSETLVQRCVLVTVPPHFFCVCPRSFNQALLLSTRWMFGRVNRMVVIGLFWCVFWAKAAADAAAGVVKRSAHRATGCTQRSWRGLCCSLLVKLLRGCCVGSQRCAIRQLFCSARCAVKRLAH